MNQLPQGISLELDNDPEKNLRMIKILEIIENHPVGLSFNVLASKSEQFVSRATLGKWLDLFANKHFIERRKGRQGQKNIIKSSADYHAWQEAQEDFEITVSVLQKQIQNLEAAAKQRVFGSTDFYTANKLLNDISKLSFSSYMTGLEYSDQIAGHLRNGVDIWIRNMHKQILSILQVQRKIHGLDYSAIFREIETIIDTSMRIELLDVKEKKDARTQMQYTKNTALQRFKILSHAAR